MPQITRFIHQRRPKPNPQGEISMSMHLSDFDEFVDDRPKKKKRKLVNSSEDEFSDIELERIPRKRKFKSELQSEKKRTKLTKDC